MIIWPKSDTTAFKREQVSGSIDSLVTRDNRWKLKCNGEGYSRAVLRRSKTFPFVEVTCDDLQRCSRNFNGIIKKCVQLPAFLLLCTDIYLLCNCYFLNIYVQSVMKVYMHSANRNALVNIKFSLIMY